MFFNLFQGKYKKAVKLVRDGSFDEAKQILLEIFNKDPRSAKVNLELARISFKTGNLHETRMYLNKFLDLDQSVKAKISVMEITNWKMVSDCRYFNHPPCFSEDGRWLVYVSAREDTNDDKRIALAAYSSHFRFSARIVL